MRKAKQGTFVAAVAAVIWLVTVRCPPAMAQDAFGFRPALAGDFAYQPLVPPGDTFTGEAFTGEAFTGEAFTDEAFTDDAFTGDTTWDSPCAETTDLTWTQRIARLARGRTQLEGGYSYLRGSVDGSDWTQHALPDMLLRFGLTDRLELRLGWPGYVSSDSDDPAIGSGLTGTLDPNVGLLYDLWGQRGWLPQAAVLAAIPVPLEGNPFALNSLQPLTQLMYSWETSDRTAVTGRSGFAIFETCWRTMDLGTTPASTWPVAACRSF